MNGFESKLERTIPLHSLILTIHDHVHRLDIQNNS